MAQSDFKAPSHWEEITIQNTQTDQAIDAKYTDIVIEAEFNSGHKILFSGPLGHGNTEIRQDTGFYYTSSAYGSGNIRYNDHSIHLYSPFYAGTQTSYKTVKAWGKTGGGVTNRSYTHRTFSERRCA